MGTSAKDEQHLGLPHEDLHSDGEDRHPGSLFQEGVKESRELSRALGGQERYFRLRSEGQTGVSHRGVPGIPRLGEGKEPLFCRPPLVASSGRTGLLALLSVSWHLCSFCFQLLITSDLDTHADISQHHLALQLQQL